MAHTETKRILPTGLRLAPSQVWGSIRLVPVLRDEVRGDLRFARRTYNDDLTIVSLKGGLLEPGQIEGLFEGFRQHGRDRSGLGLGLAITKRAIESMSGTVRAHNNPGMGCVFTIDLPRLVSSA